MRLLPAACLALAAAAPALAQVDVSPYPLGAHPADDYNQAVAVFDAGDRVTAGCLFYRGQYRFRVHLEARPDLEPSGDPALMASLNDVVGREINEWLGGDMADLLAAVDCAVAWAEANDDPLTPKARFGEAHEVVLAGLLDLRDTFAATDLAEWRAQRAENGLPNR